ncbi:MAG: ribonuclease HII [Cytophagales bacterium]
MMKKEFYVSSAELYVGCDEAGRGALAGPVVAGAVIFPKGYTSTSIKDSKKLTPKQREGLVQSIKSDAIAWGIGAASPSEIDEINILQASFLAMHRAIDALGLRQEKVHLLIDGNQFKPYKSLTHSCHVRGDQYILSISAASILAKTHRDRFMWQLAQRYPCYLWGKNKGYPTQAHRNAILLHGITPHHRTSFRLCAA